MEKSEFYKNARQDLTGPMSGVTVIEATTTWAGPMAACVLADYGARVIKIELPAGEVVRALPPFLPDSELTVPNETVNRNKESITLDLRTEQGRDLALELVRRADIFIENFRPGTMADWGLGYTDLKQVKPDIIYVSVSGFGQFGPLSDRVGYDPVAQNYSGWASLNGDPEGGPTKAPSFLADDLGGLHGALGAMAALRHRDKTGEGQHVDVALVDSIVFQSNGLATQGALGINPPRMGNEFAIAAPINSYACRDGRAFAGVLLDSHWRILCEEMQCSELGHLAAAQRIEQREVVDSKLAAYCSERTVDDVVSKFAELGLPAVRVNQATDLAVEPQIHERDLLIPTQLVDGTTVPLVGPAAKFSKTPIGIRSHAPSLGQHTAAILDELGVDEAQQMQLREADVIR